MKKMVLIMICFIMLLGCSAKDNVNDVNKSAEFLDKTAFLRKGKDKAAYLNLNIVNKNNDKFGDINGIEYAEVNLKDKSIDVDTSLKVSNFLSKKKYHKIITLDDLKSLDCEENLKKEIVQLYNEAWEKSPAEYPKHISYGTNQTVDGGFLQLVDGGKLNLVYILETPRLGIVNIEYVNANGEYLSDLCASGNATEEQKEVQEKLDEIEENIVKKQSIDINPNIDFTSDFDLKLKKLLQHFIRIENVK